MLMPVLFGCKFPVTNVPAALIGVYETTQKRENWKRFARQGDVYAQYELARSYCCKPHEGPTDGEKAYLWMCYAAKNGHAKAQTDMGQLYEGEIQYSELDITIDNERAYIWYYFADKRLNATAREKLKQLRMVFSPQEQQALESRYATAREIPCERSVETRLQQTIDPTDSDHKH